MIVQQFRQAFLGQKRIVSTQSRGQLGLLAGIDEGQKAKAKAPTFFQQGGDLDRSGRGANDYEIAESVGLGAQPESTCQEDPTADRNQQELERAKCQQEAAADKLAASHEQDGEQRQHSQGDQFHDIA